MGCSVIGSSVQQCLTRISMERTGKFEGNAIGWNAKGLKTLNCVSIGSAHRGPWRLFCTPVSLEEEFSAVQSKKYFKDEESGSEDSLEEALLETPSSEDLKALLLDSERSNLMKKLSEANQQNRFLKRQIQVSEDALVNFKSEIAVMELEIQALIGLAQEIANYTIPDGSRKINGKYIQSHLLSRLEAVQKKMEEQIKDVDTAQLQEVPLFWSGMAELNSWVLVDVLHSPEDAETLDHITLTWSVQVMGSFDGWSQGEHLSPEYTDSYTTFSTTLLLRRGRYEIKFLVDGEWQLSPEFPTVGEGLMQNNLLIVE